MTTFVERHGYVRYPVHGYKTERVCEIPGCEEVFRLRGKYYKSKGWEEMWERARTQRAFGLDHCHKHGWVRGNICQSCNNRLVWIEAGRLKPECRVWTFDGLVNVDYTAHLLNCPECAGLSAPEAARVDKQYIRPRMQSCPDCLGDGSIEYIVSDSDERAHDTCSRCNGSGRVPEVLTHCDNCGKFGRLFYDGGKGEHLCKTCFESFVENWNSEPFCIVHGGDCVGMFGCDYI